MAGGLAVTSTCHIPRPIGSREVMGVMGVLGSKERTKNGKRRGWDLEEASHLRDWQEGKSPCRDWEGEPQSRRKTQAVDTTKRADEKCPGQTAQICWVTNRPQPGVPSQLCWIIPLSRLGTLSGLSWGALARGFLCD